MLLGGAFLTSSEGACCLACQENPGCNVWTYCDKENGCGTGETHAYSYSRCSLKYQSPEVLAAKGRRVREAGGVPHVRRAAGQGRGAVRGGHRAARDGSRGTCATCLIGDAANYRATPSRTARNSSWTPPRRAARSVRTTAVQHVGVLPLRGGAATARSTCTSAAVLAQVDGAGPVAQNPVPAWERATASDGRPASSTERGARWPSPSRAGRDPAVVPTPTATPVVVVPAPVETPEPTPARRRRASNPRRKFPSCAPACFSARRRTSASKTRASAATSSPT